MAAQRVAVAERADRGVDALGQRLGEDDGEGREEQDRDEEDDEGDEAAAEPGRFRGDRAEGFRPGRRTPSKAASAMARPLGEVRDRVGPAQRHREGVERGGGHRPLRRVVVVGADRLQRLAIGLGGVAEAGDLGFEDRECCVEGRRRRAFHAAEGGVGLGAEPVLAGEDAAGADVERGGRFLEGRGAAGQPGEEAADGGGEQGRGQGGGAGGGRSVGVESVPALLRPMLSARSRQFAAPRN